MEIKDVYLDKRKDYYNKNKEHIQIKARELLNKYPWRQTFNEIKRRCKEISGKNYKYYNGKGIKCLITQDELKELWFRDKAYEMKKPSIDREDSNKDYCLQNCRFIEFSKNTKRAVSKSILQYNLQGNFIKEWASAKDAERELKVLNTSIHNHLCGRSKSAGGFKWKYKEA